MSRTGQISVQIQSQVEPEQIKPVKIKTKLVAPTREHETVEIRGVRVRGD